MKVLHIKEKMIATVLVLLFTAAALSGCKNKTAPDDLLLQPQKQEKTRLTLFMPIESAQTNSINIYQDLIMDFNVQSETIEVRVDGLPTGDGYNEALERRLDEGKGIDLFIVNADNVKQLNSKGYFYDLSGQPAFRQLNSAARQQSVVNGTAYCLPTKMTAYGLYVNVGLLRQYGLKPPQNADEFLNCCQVLKENGITPISINHGYAMTTFAMARGLYPVYQAENRDEIIARMNEGSIKISEYMLEGFRFFADLVEKGYYGDNLTAEQVAEIKANSLDLEHFIAGKTAFAVFPSGKESDFEKLAPDMEFIQQGFPVLPDDTVSLPAISSRLCVNAKGEHLEDALIVLEYLTTNRAKELMNGEETGILTVFEGENTNVDPSVQALYADATAPGQIPIEDMSLCFDYWGTIRVLCLDIIGGSTPEEAAIEYDRIQAEKVKANVP